MRSVPMPPGFVSVNVAPVCSSTESLPSRALTTRSSYAARNATKSSASAFLMTGTTRKREPSLLLRIDGEAEVDAGFDALRLAVRRAGTTRSSRACSRAARTSRDTRSDA